MNHVWSSKVFVMYIKMHKNHYDFFYLSHPWIRLRESLNMCQLYWWISFFEMHIKTSLQILYCFYSYKIYMMRVNMNKHAGRGYQREESPWQHTFHVDSRFLKEDAASLNLRHDFLKRALAGIGYITLLLLLKRGVCLWWCRWLLGKKRICFSHALHLCLIVAGCCCAALFSGLFCLFRW